MIENAHLLLALIVGIASAIGGAVGAVAAIRVELRYLRRDVRHAQATAKEALFLAARNR